MNLLNSCVFLVVCFGPRMCKVIDPKCQNGRCECCQEGLCGQGQFLPMTCYKGCIDGHRGARCFELCEHDCKTCYNNITVCDTCFDGYHPGPNNDCTEKCPPNCKSCISQFYCTSCQEGFYGIGQKKCKYKYCPRNCKCNGTKCISCNGGFYNTNNSCSNKCPVGCKTCISMDNCTECKTDYFNGNEIGDSTNLYVKNCSFKCRETCLSCQSYDMCEQCVTGNYGLKCQNECSKGCKNNRCLIDTGYCNCSSNFIGETCTECIPGKYGMLCDKSCSLNCKNRVCNRLSGNCVDGCISNAITGQKCNVCVTEDRRIATDCKKDTAFIVMGIISGVSIVINIGLVVFIILTKRQSIRRDFGSREPGVAFENETSVPTRIQDESTKQNDTERMTAENDYYNIQVETDEGIANKLATTGYEEMTEMKGPEHDYQQISQTVANRS